MASSAHTWVHCNQCMSLGSESTNRLHITSCGRVVCLSCIPSLRAANCPACRGPCARTIPLNGKAPSTVLNMFKDASDQLKPVLKVLGWQDEQMRELMRHREETVMKLMRGEEQMVEQLAASVRRVEDRKRELEEVQLEEATLRAELASLGAGEQGQGSSSRLQQTSLSLQWDQMSPSGFEHESSNSFQLTKISSSSLHYDQGNPNPLDLGRRESGSGSKEEEGVVVQQGAGARSKDVQGVVARSKGVQSAVARSRSCGQVIRRRES